MKQMGLGLIPENRKERGPMGELSMRDNMCLASLSRIAWRGLIWQGARRSGTTTDQAASYYPFGRGAGPSVVERRESAERWWWATG